MAAIDDDTLRAVLLDVADVMRANVAMPHATTADGSTAAAHYRYQPTTTTGCERGKGPIAVYGRVGLPCFQCGAAIVMFRQGAMQRSSYACPRCQPA